MMKRIINFKKEYKYQTNNVYSENYYPVTSAIYVEDNQTRLTLMNDRS